MKRNLSWPAVSLWKQKVWTPIKFSSGGVGLAYHIWSLIAFPSSSIVLILKSIPGGILVTIDFRWQMASHTSVHVCTPSSAKAWHECRGTSVWCGCSIRIGTLHPQYGGKTIHLGRTMEQALVSIQGLLFGSCFFPNEIRNHSVPSLLIIIITEECALQFRFKTFTFVVLINEPEIKHNDFWTDSYN